MTTTYLSKYQEAIIHWVMYGEGNAFVEGVAGCGKTFTIIEVVNALSHKGLHILSLAFNKSIATEMQKKFFRLKLDATAKTLHSLGFAAAKDWLQFSIGRATVRPNKFRNWNVLENLMGGKDMSDDDQKLNRSIRHAVDKLVSLAKGLCILDAQEFKTRIPELIDYYEIDFNAEYHDHVVEWAFLTYIDSLEFKIENRKIEISFDDMIFIPIWAKAKGELIRLPKYDWVLIDEAQDLNPTQIQLLEALGDCRKLFVGDPAQAIYGFTGADSNAVQTMRDLFDCQSLPLSICYRCPTKVIEHAQQYVPRIEASPDANEGEVTTVKLERFHEYAQEGEMVLCRTNAPLVKECLHMIRQGKKALIKGREVGVGLTNIIKRCSENDESMTTENLSQHLYVYMDKMMTQFEKRKQEHKKELLEDQVATIQVLIESAEEAREWVATVKDVLALIKEIFIDDPKNGIVFSSIHRAKGLEADTVWCLPSKPRKSTQEWQAEQEKNLLYVQCTRAMRRLFFVEVK